ncbi:hypothetical protein DRO55_06610, partial [Candidatus Bathyarchaeota archaeon]
IFVFHMALEIPEIMKRFGRMVAEAPPDLIPEGFNYYAGGHIHTPWQIPFKGGILVYSGCTETVSYEDANVRKGFYYVEVGGDGDLDIQRIRLESPRRFIILDDDYTGLMPSRITELVVESVRRFDEPGTVIIPIIRGIRTTEATRRDVDVAKIRNSAEAALFVRPVIDLREQDIPEEVIRSIFSGELKDLKAKAFEYFVEYFSQRYPKREAEDYARLALDLIQPLIKGDEDRVRKLVEELFRED